MDENVEAEKKKTMLIGQEPRDNFINGNPEDAPNEMIEKLSELPAMKPVSNPANPNSNVDHSDENKLKTNFSSPSNGKRKLDDCKLIVSQTNGVTADIKAGESVTRTESVPNKRNLRRISNSKESVLQNAIALKEKSFSIRDISSYGKSKSPRCNQKPPQQVRTQSPKTVVCEKKSPDSESSNLKTDPASCLGASGDVSNKSSEPTEVTKNIDDSSSQNDSKTDSSHKNPLMGAPDRPFGGKFQPVRRKKRHFKGLNYAFSRRKNSRKRRLEQLRLRRLVCDNFENSNLQNSIIVSDGVDKLAELNSSVIPTKSSQSTSVLIETATDLQTSKTTCLGVRNTRRLRAKPSLSSNDKPASPITNSIPSSDENPTLCLCQIQEQVYMKSNAGVKYYCQAIDSIEGKLIGCHNVVDAVDDDIKLQRPSVKITYQMFCKVHYHRFLLHNCCPTCGIFCTQGSFVVCNSRHMYHRKCELVVEQKAVCPHCGHSSPPSDVHVSIAQERNPFFLPLQKSLKDVPSAKITFSGSMIKPVNDKHSISSSVILPANSFALPSGKRISLDGLPSVLETEKLEKYLFGLLSCNSSSPAQRCTYRTLYQAAKTGDVEKLMACLASGLNPNHLFRDFLMGSALHAACAGGHLVVVHVLIQAGAQLDQLDKEQNTALILAIQNGHNDVIKYLVKAGASILFKGKDMTPLQLAAKLGNLDACHWILSNPKCPRQYINTMDDGGWTALVWAAEFGHLDIVKYLLSHGADPLMTDVEHNVALHWAAISGNVDVCETLLHYTSDINCSNVHGDTPLHICARRDHYTCILLLLAKGARTDIRNSAGLLPMDCCIIKPCDSYNAIKLNIELKQMSATKREKPEKILTNDITKGHEVNPIQCINARDNEPEPTDFVYVTENCFTSHIKIDNTITSLKSCKCGDTCNTMSCTCGKLSLGCWYTDDGTLSPDFNYTDPPMIFECNSVCSCHKLTCKNRVVQHGITGRFQLFRTKGKGWGVITLKLIPKGTYVCEYIGELISDIEADTREEDSYLFDLENKDGETYCIDAFRYGNIARFINHSCIPNLLPVKVFINHHDLHFPRIAFFSNRDIQPNEELGFDYGEKFWIIKYKSFTCTCGAENCRYSETTIRQTLDAYNKRLQMEDSNS